MSACLTMLILKVMRLSEMPVPRPVACSGVILEKAATIAALEVVLPIPISPRLKHL